jgi:hypothetical protein
VSPGETLKLQWLIPILRSLKKSLQPLVSNSNQADKLKQISFLYAIIGIKEDTPVFSVLKPVTVPLEDNASGATTLIIFIFLGGIVGVGWIFGKEFLNSLKDKWNTEEPAIETK